MKVRALLQLENCSRPLHEIIRRRCYRWRATRPAD